MGAARSASRTRCSGSGATARWYWRGMFELIPLPLAGRSTSATRRRRLRALARRAPADRSGVSARRVRLARQASAAIRGETRADARRTACSISRAGIPNRRAAIQRARAPGASRIWSATAGNGPARRSRRFPGFRPMASYPEYSADFFDGEHFVMKGASPATARELLRPTFRNWFRAAVSVCLCDLPLRNQRRNRSHGAAPPNGAVRRRRRSTT